MREQPVVVELPEQRRERQHHVCAGALGVAAGPVSFQAAEADDDGDPAPGRRDGGAGDQVALVVVEVGELAGGPEGHHAVGALVDHLVDERRERLRVDRSSRVERREQGDEDALHEGGAGRRVDVGHCGSSCLETQQLQDGRLPLDARSL